MLTYGHKALFSLQLLPAMNKLLLTPFPFPYLSLAIAFYHLFFCSNVLPILFSPFRSFRSFILIPLPIHDISDIVGSEFSILFLMRYVTSTLYFIYYEVYLFLSKPILDHATVAMTLGYDEINRNV